MKLKAKYLSVQCLELPSVQVQVTVKTLRISVISKVLSKLKLRRMPGGMAREGGGVAHPSRDAAGNSALSSTSSILTYAGTADSSGDLYQIQTVKNNLLNTFLDKLKPKTFLSPVQPYFKGRTGKVRHFPSRIPDSDFCPSVFSCHKSNCTTKS